MFGISLLVHVGFKRPQTRALLALTPRNYRASSVVVVHNLFQRVFDARPLVHVQGLQAAPVVLQGADRAHKPQVERVLGHSLAKLELAISLAEEHRDLGAEMSSLYNLGKAFHIHILTWL